MDGFAEAEAKGVPVIEEVEASPDTVITEEDDEARAGLLAAAPSRLGGLLLPRRDRRGAGRAWFYVELAATEMPREV